MSPAKGKLEPSRLAPGAMIGPYKIVAAIGAGGMGEVFRARDERLKRDVAVKVLPRAFAEDPDRMRRFADEARAAGGLNHPGILAVHDFGEDGGVPYIVTELLEGQSLRERLAGGRLVARKAIDMAAQVAQALAAAHEKGIVHRDLKPENLFVLNDGRVKILDFGLVKALAKDGEGEDGGDVDAGAATAVASTQTGKILGTPGYMAPEQARGSDAIDARTDLFAIGAVLYEMLAGAPAFPGDSPVERSFAVLKHDPGPLPERTPPALELVVRRCLEKNPAERFQSARDLAFSLHALSNTSATGAVPVLGRPAVERRWPAVAGAAAAVVAIGVGGFLVGRATGGRGVGAAPAPQVEYQRLLFRHGVVKRARFGPEGRTVLFGAELDGDEPQVYETTPGQGRARGISVTGAGLWDVSPSGELALSVHRRTLARASISGGQPRELQENVSDAAWAPDGQALAVVVQARRLEMPPGTVVYEGGGVLESPRVSPDGKRLAVIEKPAGNADSRGRVLVAARGEKARPVGPEWRSIDGLAWSPDGRELWLSAGEAPAQRALRALTLAGESRVLLRLPGVIALDDVARDGRALIVSSSVHQHVVGFAPGGPERDLACSDSDMLAGLTPDGAKLLLNEGSSGPERKTTLRATDGSPPLEVGTGRGYALSADGKWVLLSPRSPWNQLVLVPTGAGEQQVQPGDAISEYTAAAFTSDPRRFVVVGRAAGGGPRVRLWVQQAGEPPKPIGPESMNLASPVSPDDKFVIGRVLGGEAGGKLVRVPLDGGPVAELPGLAARTTVTSFTPDGNQAYLVRRLDEGDGVALEVYDFASGKVTRMTALEAMLANRPVTNVILARDGQRGVALVSETGTELYQVSGLK